MSESHESAYNRVWVWLAVLTVIEVIAALPSLRFLSWNMLMGVLIGLAIVKASMVAMYFMHLRFDKAVFRRLFATGLILAVAVFTVVLLSEHADLNHSSETPPTTTAPADGATGGE